MRQQGRRHRRHGTTGRDPARRRCRRRRRRQNPSLLAGPVPKPSQRGKCPATTNGTEGHRSGGRRQGKRRATARSARSSHVPLAAAHHSRREHELCSYPGPQPHRAAGRATPSGRQSAGASGADTDSDANSPAQTGEPTTNRATESRHATKDRKSRGSPQAPQPQATAPASHNRRSRKQKIRNPHPRPTCQTPSLPPHTTPRSTKREDE